MFSFDLTAAFVVYGCTFCHGYIANVYGPAGHLMALLAVGLLQRTVLFGSANPLPHIIKLVECNNACDVRIQSSGAPGEDHVTCVHLTLNTNPNAVRTCGAEIK